MFLDVLSIYEYQSFLCGKMIDLEQLSNFHLCFLVSLADRFVAINIIAQRLAGPLRTAAVDSDPGGLNDLDILQRIIVLDPQTLPCTKRIFAVLFIKLVRHAELRGAVAQLVRF